MSEMPGQSGHALPDLQQPVCANNRRCAVSLRALALTLGELPPCPLCGPPYEPAPADNEHAQRNPSINSCGNEPRAQHEHRYDHRKIIRAGIAAVRAIASSRVQYARHAHPNETDDPDRGANRYRDKQAHKNGCVR
jgi:hypothetical protein